MVNFLVHMHTLILLLGLEKVMIRSIDPADNSSVEELPCRLLDPPLATVLSARTLLEPPSWELRTLPAKHTDGASSGRLHSDAQVRSQNH